MTKNIGLKIFWEKNFCGKNFLVTKTIFNFQKDTSYDIKILHAKKRPDLHFMVVDNIHYRIEKRHPAEKHLSANILYNQHFAAGFHRYLFIKKWEEISKDEEDFGE